MELCWEFLDKMYLTRGGNLRVRSNSIGGGNMYVYVDACKHCGKPFLATKFSTKGNIVIDEFCCQDCSGQFMVGKKNSIEHNKNISKGRSGIEFSIEHKQRLSEARRGKNHPAYKGGVVRKNLPLYDTYACQFQPNFEETFVVYDNELKLLGVRCNNSSCGRVFVPKRTSVQHRLEAFDGTSQGQNNFYCSDICKATCPTYKCRGELPNILKEKLYTRSEYILYRKTVLERENYVCEYCSKPATDVHHEQPQKEQPMLVLDPDYGHACCKECHYKYGHKTGTECSTGNLAKKIC